MDDILLFSETMEEHKKLVAQVKEALNILEFTINEKKSEYFETNLKYLGVEISHNKIVPYAGNVEAINSLKRPTNIREIQILLGMVNHFSKFIGNFANILVPLTDLLKKNHN